MEITPPKVRVNIKFLVNLGNFSNFEIELGVEDFKKDTESIDQATERVYGFVESKMLEKVDELKSEMSVRVSKK